MFATAARRRIRGMSDTPAPIMSAAGAADDDSVAAVVSLYQKHKKIYARAVTGQFATWRWGMVWLTQVIFYSLPWLKGKVQ